MRFFFLIQLPVALNSILFLNAIKHRVCFAYWRVVAILRADDFSVITIASFISSELACSFFHLFLLREDFPVTISFLA